MKNHTFYKYRSAHSMSVLLVLTLFLIGLSGCGGGGGGSDSPVENNDDQDPPAVTPANVAPVAEAGHNQNVLLGDTVALDASASFDEDGDTLTYTWVVLDQPENSDISLSDESAAKPTFTATHVGQYVFELLVNDGELDSDADAVTIRVERGNVSPTADAGGNQSVKTGSLVTLDGSMSSDPDGDSITYQWSVEQVPSGSVASLSDNQTANPTFVADFDGVYVFGLVVNDGEAISEMDTVEITSATPNSAPVAHAGRDQDVIEGSTVSLDGSMSSDADMDELSYQWSFVSLPSGSAASFTDARSATPEFTADKPGTFVIRLIVNDGELDSEGDNVVVEVTKANVKPVANAGDDQSTEEDTLVTLDGSDSLDPDGDSLTYQWQVVSVPAGANVVLDDSTAVAPSFTPNAVGSYVFALIVNDGELNSAEDRVTVTVSEKNLAPNADAGRDINVMTGTVATLDGSGTSDANGDTLTYQWVFISKPTGSAAELTNAATIGASFTPDLDGTYVLELTASDGELSGSDRVIVTAESTNSAPVAEAGFSLTYYLGRNVSLSGSSSYDPDGDPLTYQWDFTKKPSGSVAQLDDPTSVTPSFTPDVAGEYVVRLVVNDGREDSLSDTVLVTMLPPTLRLETYDDTGIGSPTWERAALSFYSDVAINRSCSGTCDPISLGRFRLTAMAGDFTLENIKVTNLSGGESFPSGLNPRFEGLETPTHVAEGDRREYRLVVDYIPVNTEVEFFYQVEGTNKTFTARYTLDLR